MALNYAQNFMYDLSQYPCYGLVNNSDLLLHFCVSATMLHSFRSNIVARMFSLSYITLHQWSEPKL